MYFPAIPRLTQIFHEPTDRLNPTLTIFLVTQAVYPMLWGPFSDRFGRRPSINLCFAILIISCIGAGVIADITIRANRGTFFGAFNVGPMLSPGIGPVVGGLLSQYLGWRAIFWFLTIFSSVSMLVILGYFLPETLPCIVGNGSIRPSFIYRALLPVVGKGRMTEDSQLVQKPRPKPFRNPFLLFLNADVVVATFLTSVIFAMQYRISRTLSNAYTIQYPFSQQCQYWLCYLLDGLGLVGGTIINGKLLDMECRRSRARAGTPFTVFLFSACIFGWGWCIDRSVSLAGPLLFQIALGFSSICVLDTTTTLMIDLVPDQSSAVTACTNFFRSAVRCHSSRIPRESHQKSGLWVDLTFVIFGCIYVSMAPLVFLELKIGLTFRVRRLTRASEVLKNEYRRT
ncbi:MFS general substrate transporter [Guyanagaster necrorhizus]|uniref:MFS general substrate transporter n=1 Tax=Guyanagaster necrorhizus TaxID=856835 RepID=A0A9P7VKY6_9AGAR|nr:MFS general substrate transporter [Guyanagaster necrorhizus MCA 3950]KAG7443041.1 MFS general substrate transporter [Guyanagaster necrorhizus MCA 3950]